MDLQTMLKKYSFPVGCHYNCKTKGGSKLGGEATVSSVTNEEKRHHELLMQYVEWAMNRVCNS